MSSSPSGWSWLELFAGSSFGRGLCISECSVNNIFDVAIPQLFPGLIYRVIKPTVVLLIFVSGKIVLIGNELDACFLFSDHTLLIAVHGYLPPFSLCQAREMYAVSNKISTAFNARSVNPPNGEYTTTWRFPA